MRNALLIACFLTGCDRLAYIDSLANPVVAQGMFLGVDIPAGMDLSDAEGLDQTALCNVFLAYVADPSALADAPLEGATIELASPANGRLQFREEGGGKYTLDASDGLSYVVGDNPVVTFTVDGQEGKLTVLTPEAPEVDLPAATTILEPLPVDLTGRAYQNVVAAAYDVNRSRMTWDNLPQAVDEVYDFTHTEDAVEEVEIPGDAFQRKGLYVVGVAGMKVGDTETFEGVNTTLSAFIAGQVTPRILSVEADD